LNKALNVLSNLNGRAQPAETSYVVFREQDEHLRVETRRRYFWRTAMQQIADWLNQLGMSEYAQRFAENRIDFSVLPDLTDQHLKDLGIALGDRLKLLRAIRELGSAPPISPKVSSSEPKIQELAERRQITVMFSDLVGSTALSARMDPEDLREVISAYQKCVAETVRRFGGFVAKYMGDGVLAYFGYPAAHEDDAERAVRAALELIASVTALKTPASLQTRVGIATGLVVVGDLIGSGGAQEQAIVGETPNLAARLQGIAPPNTVVIAEGTRKLLGTLFELEDLGPKDLKGIAGPVRVWAALRASSVESRFEALHAAGLIWSGAKKKSNCCFAAGQGQTAVKARSSCSPENLVSANRVSLLRYWNASRPNLTSICAISARRSTPTARFTRSSVRWHAPPP
jgi:class 3 adenylate cyclase